MKFSAEKEGFVSAVAKVSRSVSQKSSIPVLEGILLKAEGDKVLLTGYDLEIAISSEVDANVQRSGSAVISAKLLGDICRSMNGSTIDMECNDLKVELSSGGAFYEISSMNVDDYPELPKQSTFPAATVDGHLLKEMIELTLFACSQNDKKPVNTGELFELKDGTLNIVALDGYRLATCKKEIKQDGEDMNIIIPYKTMQEVNRMLGEKSGEIKISASNFYVMFSGEDFSLLSRLIEGDFVDYLKVIPDGVKTEVTVNVNSLMKCIDRASNVINERIRNPLRLTFDEKGIHVACRTAIGSFNEDVECEDFSGLPLEIGFNNRYISEALRACNCDKLIFEIVDSVTAVKVYPPDKQGFLYLVLPVRFKVGGNKTEE